MKRALSFLFAFLLLAGLASGCSDDKDEKATDTTEAPSGEDGGDSGDSASSDPEVAAYCEAVEAYVAKAKEVMADPASADRGRLQPGSRFGSHRQLTGPPTTSGSQRCPVPRHGAPSRQGP